MSLSDDALTLEPIGYVRSPLVDLAEAPRQPTAAKDICGSIELRSDRNLAHAIEDLESWEYIWVLFWFHRAGGYAPKVLPPRSNKKRGVLATRSPHRPNPIGMSAVRLERIDGLTLHIRNLDLIEGTPVLDIKPYVPYADVVDTQSPGWLDEASAPIEAPTDPLPSYQVVWSGEAQAQLAFLETLGVVLEEAVSRHLALGPHARAYRRIRRAGPNGQLAWKAWRFAFSVDGLTILIERIHTGYRPKELARSDEPEIAHHRALVDTFPASVWHAPPRD